MRTVNTALSAAATSVAFLVAVAGCDPCSGVAACGATSPRVAIDGQIVRAEDGRGADGVRIDVVRTGGIPIAEDSASTVTRDGGHWHVEIPTTTAGDVLVDVRVIPPSPGHAYTVHGVRVSTVDREGEARLLERWVVDPYFASAADLFIRMSNQPAVNLPVVFRRTSGVSLLGPSVRDSLVMLSTDIFGRVQLFFYNAFPVDTGSVVGDLTVRLPDPLGTTAIRGVRLTPTHIYREQPSLSRFGVGPNLDYVAFIFDRATGRPAPGVEMMFRRVGGIPVSLDTMTRTSDENGRVHFTTWPLAAGQVIADITLRHPRGTPERFRDTLSTFDADNARVHAIWTAGPYLPYFGVAYAFGRPIEGMPVRVRRTGGIDVTPADTVVRTSATGVVVLGPVPQATGEVVFELTFTPPPPYRAFMLRNVRLSTLQQDVPQGRVVWVWNFEAGPSGPVGSEVVLLP